MFRLFNIFKTANFISLVIYITGIAWLFEKIISWRVWTTYRLFPTTPVFEFLDQVPASVHLFLFLAQILLIVLMICLRRKNIILLFLLLVEACSYLLDQNRLQPYDYLYFTIIFILLINKNSKTAIPVFVIFILASTYFYSGLGKLNPGFIDEVWTKLILKLFFKFSQATTEKTWLQNLGYVISVTEIIAGFCLLFNKTRFYAGWFLILMHLFILLMLGPFGLRYNMVVWPWNVAMIFYLITILYNNNKVSFSLAVMFSGWNKLIFLTWGILPFFNLFDYWDNYLSSGLYSGKLPKMTICINDTTKCSQLKRFYKLPGFANCDGEAIINVQKWAIDEMKILPYPEIRTYKQIEKKLLKKYPDAGMSFIYAIPSEEK